jgi:ribosomal protein L15
MLARWRVTHPSNCATQRSCVHRTTQGGSCGYGMRGQNARSGPSTRPGFEGGQIPLYRRMPKLKGIAGGMPAGRTSHVVVNVKQLGEKFAEGETVSLQTLKDKSLLNVSGRDRGLGLKVLGDGELPFPLMLQAESFSALAREKIEAMGGTAKVVPARQKWTRKAHEFKLKKKGGKKVVKRETGRPKKEWPAEVTANPKWVNPGAEASKKGQAPARKAKRAQERLQYHEAKKREAAAARKAAGGKAPES